MGDVYEQLWSQLNIPEDIAPSVLGTSNEDRDIRKQLYSVATDQDSVNGFFMVYESTVPLEGDTKVTTDYSVGNKNEDVSPPTMTDWTKGGRRKKVPTVSEKAYRSDREYVKRHSHQRMIWFFRRVGLRHPAAIRTHLERVKHPEFELPNLQCVFPHPELSIGFDDRPQVNNDRPPHYSKGGRRLNDVHGNASVAAHNRTTNEISTNLTYYNLYCATDELVRRVRSLMGEPKHDPDYNKKVVTFIADVVGRLLWHNNRIHSVMFAKSDHYDRECFILYSRQAEPTPCMMRSDKFFCRRHHTEKFKCLAPQSDLTRANSNRVSNESSIYIVGCNLFELSEDFPYEYRITHCRPMKALCEVVTRVDPSVLEHAFSAIIAHLNGDRQNSTCPEVAAKPGFDLLSALLGETDLKNVVNDDSVAYKDYIERFITIGVLNVHSILKCHYERDYRHASTLKPSIDRLDQIVLHHVRYRHEVRSLRTNRVFYYRNADNFICSLSLLDDLFEDRKQVDADKDIDRKPVYFYDILQPFEYVDMDVNNLALYCWKDAEEMINESSYTIGQRFTPDLLLKPLPKDPFYPVCDMSSNDIAIDRMLERSIKHSKKIKLPTPSKKRLSKKKAAYNRLTREDKCASPLQNRAAIEKSLSKMGENRLRDGYRTPPMDFETWVSHGGQMYPVKITAAEPKSTTCSSVDYGPRPSVLLGGQPLCAYLIDPKETRQIHTVSGSRLKNTNANEYVPLNRTDRIVRVFAIQANGDNSYLIKPYVYFVFRNMPVSTIDDSLVEDMYENIKSYKGFHGFKIFDEYEKQSDTVVPVSGVSSEFVQRVQTYEREEQNDHRGQGDPSTPMNHWDQSYCHMNNTNETHCHWFTPSCNDS